MRSFTKVERRILDLSPTNAAQISHLWTTGKRVQVKPYTWTNSGRTLSGTSRGKFVNVLKKIGVKERDLYFGNDAPRGGMEGKWVQLAPSGWQKIKRAFGE